VGKGRYSVTRPNIARSAGFLCKTTSTTEKTVIDLEKKSKFHYPTAEAVIDTIAAAYINGTQVGWDGLRGQCFYMLPENIDDEGHEERPTCNPNDPVSSCALGVLLRDAGLDAEQLWDDGIRNEHAADRVAIQYDIRIADWSDSRTHRFLQSCQTLHDRFASSGVANAMPSKALGYMFRLMMPMLISASADGAPTEAAQLRKAINVAFIY
jgi:hypothetical protein